MPAIFACRSRLCAKACDVRCAAGLVNYSEGCLLGHRDSALLFHRESRVALIFLELVNAHRAVGEAGSDLKLPAHGGDELAQRTHVQVGPPL